MTAKTVSFETGHEEMIHDGQLDYYGKRLATASSDRSIRIFDVTTDRQTLIATIKGHDGPVWQVCWAHPKFGPLLSSCSYDGRIIVWKEAQQNHWIKIYEYYRPESSINSISFAPHTFGLILISGNADGTISILTRKENNQWDQYNYLAHKGGVTSVNWGPDMKTGALLANANSLGGMRFERRFVSGGCDNRIRIWRYDEVVNQWTEQKTWSSPDENVHLDWVRDVAWAPSIGLPSNTIASASEDKTVAIWNEDANGIWKKHKILKFDTKVWRVSWSLMGNILAISTGDNAVSLWKEAVDGEWKNLKTIEEGQQ